MKEKKIEDYTEEIWREINGTNGLYQISNHGRVMRRAKIIRRKGQKPFFSKAIIMKTPLAGAGYPSVLIQMGDKPKRFFIHRLVGEYFIANPENKPEINHLFGDKTDNYYEHLAWVTEKENINHAFDNGLNKKVQPNDPKRSKVVLQCNTLWEVIAEFLSTMDVQRSLGFKAPNINHAIKHKKMSHGYYWKYK